MQISSLSLFHYAGTFENFPDIRNNGNTDIQRGGGGKEEDRQAEKQQNLNL
jgi:hypothetical protein